MTGELIRVEDQLDVYFSALQDAETDEQRTQVELVLTQVIQEAASRVDSVVAWFQRGDSEIEWLKAEKARLSEVIERWERKQKTVRQILAAHMDTHNIKKLPGRAHNISFRKGTLGVEVLDEHAVPLRFREITITLPGEVWAELRAMAAANAEVQGVVEQAARVSKTKVDKKAIKEAIENFEEVPGAALVEGTPTVMVK